MKRGDEITSDEKERKVKKMKTERGTKTKVRGKD